MASSWQSLPKNVRGRISYSIVSQVTGATGLSGTLSVQVSNASAHNQAIIDPVDWVTLPLDIPIGQGTPPPTPPYCQHIAVNGFNYVRLSWVFTAGTGTLYAKISNID
jgi:hypothetical protein